MNTFRSTVFLAVVAGLLAGLALSVMQHFAATPVILHAETYENAAPAAHEHAPGTPDHSHDAAPAAPAAAAAEADHHHDPEAWAPADGFERTAYSILSAVVTGIGFALILVVASELAGGIHSWRQGALWGLAGFAVFVLAPQLGLPPELPGMPAAELAGRQVWWIFAAAATAIGLALIVFKGTALWSLVGLAVIALPQLIGAPQPVTHETAVPAGLLHQFVVNTTIANLAFWVLLGGLVGLFHNRFFGAEATLEGKFA